MKIPRNTLEIINNLRYCIRSEGGNCRDLLQTLTEIPDFDGALITAGFFVTKDGRIVDDYWWLALPDGSYLDTEQDRFTDQESFGDICHYSEKDPKHKHYFPYTGEPGIPMDVLNFADKAKARERHGKNRKRFGEMIEAHQGPVVEPETPRGWDDLDNVIQESRRTVVRDVYHVTSTRSKFSNLSTQGNMLFFSKRPRTTDFGKRVFFGDIWFNEPYLLNINETEQIVDLIPTDSIVRIIADLEGIENRDEISEILNEYNPEEYLLEKLEQDMGAWQHPIFVQAIKEAGHDGVIAQDPFGGETEYVIFYDKQFKQKKQYTAEDFSGRPVGDPNAQQRWDIPNALTVGGQSAVPQEESDEEFKPEEFEDKLRQLTMDDLSDGEKSEDLSLSDLEDENIQEVDHPEYMPDEGPARYDPNLNLGRPEDRQPGYNTGHPKP